MDLENEDQDQELEPQQSQPAQPRPKPVTNPDGSKTIKPRKKPLVEGINAPTGGGTLSSYSSSASQQSQAPQVRSTLTPQEQELLQEPQPQPQFKPRYAPLGNLSDDLPKRHHRVKGPIITFIILALLIAAGYEIYVRYLNSQSISNSNLPLPNNAMVTGSTTPTGLGSSTPSSIISTSTLAGTGSSTSSSTAVSGASTTPAALGTVLVNSTPTGYLNVRQQPSTGSAIITQVHPGDSYPFVAKQNGWYEITLPTGQNGWVSGQYVTPQ